MMTPLLFLAVALAGGVGAGLRWLVDVTLTTPRGFPWPIMLVNVTGCFAMMLVLHTTSVTGIAPEVLTVVTAGLLGGYTTFGTVNVDAIELWRAGRRWAAIGNSAGTLLACTVGAALGLYLAVVLVGA